MNRLLHAKSSATTTGMAAIAWMTFACGAAVAVPVIPPQPVNWKPGVEVRAYAGGKASQTREFVWGRKLEPVSGVLRLRAVDNSWQGSEDTPDLLQECVARVTVPEIQSEYYIRLTGLRREGMRRPTLGGVMVGGDLFGNTDLGGPGLFPRLHAQVAVWGLGNVVKNGKVIGRDRTVLAWVGDGARSSNGQWLFDADRSRTSAHLIVFGTLGHGETLENTRDGFLHFAWPTAIVKVGTTL